MKIKLILLLLTGMAWSAVAVPSKPAVKAPAKPVMSDEVYKDMALFVSVMKMLNQEYVDADKATFSKLIRGALTGMLGSLDRYSAYLPKQEFSGLIENTGGRYVGIGIVYQYTGKSLRIERVIEDSPAAKVGLRGGDELVSINGRPIVNLALKDCVALLRGDAGTAIKLGYVRSPAAAPVEVDVFRDKVVTSPVPDSGVKYLADGIGYIRIDTFSAPLNDFVDRAMDKLKERKLTGLVVDLRDNPGGLLEVAVKFCSRFIPRGKTVVKTIGRSPKDNITYWSMDCDKYPDVPLVLLVNHNSASAAEVTAGCLKDHHRAVLIGENTYGKASVQRIQNLPENYGGIRFTVAWYHTPNDIRIQDRGIEPDIRVEIPSASRPQFSAQLRRFPGEINPKFRGAVTDIQLQRAVEILQGLQLFSQAER